MIWCCNFLAGWSKRSIYISVPRLLFVRNSLIRMKKKKKSFSRHHAMMIIGHHSMWLSAVGASVTGPIYWYVHSFLNLKDSIIWVIIIFARIFIYIAWSKRNRFWKIRNYLSYFNFVNFIALLSIFQYVFKVFKFTYEALIDVNFFYSESEPQNLLTLIIIDMTY